MKNIVRVHFLGNLIYPNLENGIVIPEDKVKMISLAEKYIKKNDADALLLGCTEIPLMIVSGTGELLYVLLCVS